MARVSIDVVGTLAVCLAISQMQGTPAMALSGLGASPPSANAAMVTRIHGFHCRKELGWDARAGAYHYHRHEGICRDYKRCLNEQQRCVFLLGRGWDGWKYERFGWDNWRYTSCMIRNGCY
jgi:hypothetical protein